MYVKQNLSILFYRKMKKRNRDGQVPIYARVTIDALDDEISTSLKINPDHWDNHTKTVVDKDPDHKRINKRICQMQTDLERIFDLLQAKHQIASPEMVLATYRSLLNGQRIKEEKIKNLELSDAIFDQSARYVDYFNQMESLHRESPDLVAEKKAKFDEQKKALDEQIKALAKKSGSVFDNKAWEKTVMPALVESLMNYLLLVLAGKRAFTTLEKNMGRNKRYLAFIEFTYEKIDLPLCELQFNFLDKFVTYNMVHKQVDENTAMKHAQHFKEIINRCVANGWMTANIFHCFKCKFVEPQHDWLTWEQFNDLMHTDFDDKVLNLARDIYVFCSFTGLSYQEVYYLRPSDIITGIDSKK